MNYSGYRRMRVNVAGRLVNAVIDNPPMNMLTGDLIGELDRFTRDVAADPDILVVVLKSATPGFFICHAPYGELGNLKTARMPQSPDEVPLNLVQSIGERLRAMDKVSIAQVEGRASGGGAALTLACDLRYGAIGGAVFNSMGVPIGTGLGGGASQFMPRQVGQSRAMELILAGLDLDAVTGDRWGYLTRAIERGEIDAFVADLAARIASCSVPAIRLTKQLVAAAAETPLAEGLRNENFRLQQLMSTAEAIDGIKLFLDLGGETPAGESRLGDLLAEVLDRAGR